MNTKSNPAHNDSVRRYFDRLSTTWEDKYAKNGSMRYRLARFEGALTACVAPPGPILDFGCGPGDLSGHLASAGYRVVGIDQSSSMVGRASARFSRLGVEFASLDPNKTNPVHLPFRNSEFRGCVASSVLEYVSPVGSYLNELRRVVAHDGVLVMTVPNILHPVRMAECVEKAVLHPLLRGHVSTEERRKYLESSINRFRVGKWRHLLSACGWRLYSVEGRNLPLLMLCARGDSGC